MSEVVYVSWYKKVVEGTIVKREDLFGMVAVSIPIQGVQSTALFQPDHVYKTPQEARRQYLGMSPTPETFQHPVSVSVGETVSKAIEELKVSIDLGREGGDKTSIMVLYSDLENFKKEHWDHEHDRLKLDYWQEYDRMFHAYMRLKNGLQEPQRMKTMEIEEPASNEEFGQKIIPSFGSGRSDYFYKQYQEARKKINKADLSKAVTSRTIGKKVTVTELNLF